MLDFCPKSGNESKLTCSKAPDSIAGSTFTSCTDFLGFCCWPCPRLV
jgi:hypothetical protein